MYLKYIQWFGFFLMAGCFLGDASAQERQGEAVPRDAFGVWVDRLLKEQSLQWFGVKEPLLSSATEAVERDSNQTASQLIELAKGLQVSFVTRQAANYTDMMVLWPNRRQPQYLISCVEGDRSEISENRYNPSVQRIHLQSGKVEVILRGMSHCDGIRQTPWQTIVATEETADGGVYEIFSPLTTTEEIIESREAGRVRTQTGEISRHIAKRTALPVIIWEGFEVLPNGVVVGGSELRPGTTGRDHDGGALYKFIPSRLYKNETVAQLNDSPLVAGSVAVLQVWCYESGHIANPQYGQGCEVGNAGWVSVDAKNAELQAQAKGATGFYRPEDLHVDPHFKGVGVRYCWTNTGNKQAHHYAEVMCAQDIEPEVASSKKATVILNRFVEGDSAFNSFDNLDFQPSTGNLYILEDTPFSDILACLPDSTDRDIKSDGCIRIASLKDPSAELTGLIFTEDGKTAFVSIQHSKDHRMPLVDGYPTDDVLMITGW
jgi:Bacterial protein of unknown function (DUF839)